MDGRFVAVRPQRGLLVDEEFGAGRSHWGLLVDEEFRAGHDQGWEWACSRKGRHIQCCC